ncbi:MAG: hypothetical protein GY814_20280, partial [Gammaproteobacteria bacterium]|nr:hypothetical protein [Gammaproteobacteria bacterium]
DKYERAFNPVEVGTWGTKLRARNPEYQNRPIRYYSGYLDNGVFNYSNFQQRSYVIDSLNARNGDVAITAKDILKLVSSKKAQAPAVNTGLTTAELSAVATTIDVDDGTDYTTGYVLIGAEVIEVTNISTNTLTLVRAQFNTTAVVHSSGVTVQQCLYYDGETVDYIVNDLLTNYSSIDSSFIP